MKKRFLSGVQPTGELHIGNYLGAVKNWISYQSQYDCIFFIADYHALTVPYKAREFQKCIISVAATLLAAGIDPEKSILFVQSQVPEHTELTWILACLTPIGELERMTQYKDKRNLPGEGPNAGLLAYPVLQAADILLYKTQYVPVGKDQEQHIELTRTIARKFNMRFKTRFTIPETLVPKFGAKIMSLQDPGKKMSKTGDEAIALTDSPQAIRGKIKKAVTDSDHDVRYDPDAKPAISNLMTIYHCFSGISLTEIEKQYEKKGYAEFKSDLAEMVIHGLQSFRGRRNEILRDAAYIERVLTQGKKRAQRIAQTTLKEVKEKLGLL